jgi:hypothetical protein
MNRIQKWFMTCVTIQGTTALAESSHEIIAFAHVAKKLISSPHSKILLSRGAMFTNKSLKFASNYLMRETHKTQAQGVNPDTLRYTGPIDQAEYGGVYP